MSNSSHSYLVKFLCGICIIFNCTLVAQTYTFSPGTVFIANLDTSQTDFGGIEIVNTGTQNLDLTWRLVLKDTLIDSRFELCNSGICFLNTPNSGTMPTIAPGETGWLKFHLYSGKATGVNTVKYVLKNGSIQSDTLTFILNVSTTNGIKVVIDDRTNFSVYPNPTANETSVNITLIKESEVKLSVLNNRGQSVFQTVAKLNAGNSKINLDTKQFASGIYHVILTTENGIVTKKLVVAK